MGNYTILKMFENPRRGRQARNFTINVPKILDLKSSSEQIFSENCRWVTLKKGFSFAEAKEYDEEKQGKIRCTVSFSRHIYMMSLR